MTPQELKELALKASQKQYEEVIATLKAATEQGEFTCIVTDLKDGTLELLRKDGFKVVQRRNRGHLTNSYEVSVIKD